MEIFTTLLSSGVPPPKPPVRVALLRKHGIDTA